MQDQVKSIWRERPKLARIAFAIFGLALLSKWAYLAITGMIWAPSIEFSILPARDYQIYQFVSLLAQNSDILIYSLVFAFLAMFYLLVTGFINLREFLFIYVHPIKYPSLAGYFFLLFIVFEAAVAGSNAQLGLINSIVFSKDTLKLLNLYNQQNFLLLLIYFVAFILSVEWDRATKEIYSVNLRSIKKDYLLREVLFAILVLPITFVAGKAYGYIVKIGWNASIALNQGELEYFRPLCFPIHLAEAMLIGIVMIGILPFLYRLIPIANRPILPKKTFAFGLLAIIVPLGIIQYFDSYLKRNYDTGKLNLQEAASLETVETNEKTMIYFDLLESPSSVTIEEVSLNQSFSEKPFLYTGRYENPNLSYNKANLVKTKNYLEKMNGKGAYTNSARVFLGYGYYLLMEPEQGSMWLHQAATIPPKNLQRTLETFRLRISPVREPYISYLMDYLDESKWKIGPCMKNKLAFCLNHFGERELAEKYLDEYRSECESKFKDNNLALDIPLLRGTIVGEVKTVSPNKGKIRVGILGFTSLRQAEWSQKWILRWEAFKVTNHLVDTASIDEKGRFIFDHLGHGFYYLVLMADPEVIPSNYALVAIHNPPGRIELSNENPVADLGTIVIEILPEPLKEEP
ncbi:MAG: hypothetical protein A2V67_10415 [Deltaproteobacteria bacterium RBG_13_61_14]|nr:MAG: hypothetical protein A2V67_10415 [Deltaproteobacteria bacterium RBG_13_61_14]